MGWLMKSRMERQIRANYSCCLRKVRQVRNTESFIHYFLINELSAIIYYFMIILFLLPLASCIHYVKTYIESVHALQNDPDHLSLVLAIKPNCTRSSTALLILEEYAKEIHDLLNVRHLRNKIVVVDCTTIDQPHHLPLCEKPQNLPLAMYLIPPNQTQSKDRVHPKEKLLTGISIKDLRTGFEENSPKFWQIIESPQQYDKFLADKRLNKVLTTVTSNPIWWFGITQAYHFRLDFAVVTNSSLLKSDLVILKAGKHGDYQEQQYIGAKRYESLRAYLQKFAKLERVFPNASEIRIDPKKVKQISRYTDEVSHENDFVMLYYHNGEENYQYSKLKSDLKNFFQIYEIQDARHKNQLFVFPFGQKERSIEIKPNYNMLHVCSYLLDEIPKRTNTNVADLLKLIQQLPVQRRLIITFFFEGQRVNKCQKLWAETIANKKEFRDHIIVYTIVDGPKELLEQYSVKKMPTLSSLSIESGKITQVDFDHYFDYEHIQQFLLKVVNKHKGNNQQLHKANSFEELEFFCNQGVPCALGIIDPTVEGDLDAVKKVMIENDDDFVWVILDAKCQGLLMRKFGLKPPSMMLYDRKNYRVSVMKRTFNVPSMDAFVKQKKFQWIEIDYELEIQKCKERPIKDDL